MILVPRSERIKGYKTFMEYMGWLDMCSDDVEGTKLRRGVYRYNPMMEDKPLIGCPPKHPDYLAKTVKDLDLEFNLPLMMEIFQKVSIDTGVLLGFSENSYLLSVDGDVSRIDKTYKLTEVLYHFCLPIVKSILKNREKRSKQNAKNSEK